MNDRNAREETAMKMEIASRGGAKVEARFHGYSVVTDQPVGNGGEGSAPAPFDLFLASIGTCAGYYAVQFCHHRDLPLDGLGMTLETVRDPKAPRIARIAIDVRLPEGFPDKYRPALLRAIDQCAVKRHIVEPPAIEVTLHDPAPAAAG
jgi:ribosomal protein S12 methylthiotransferase accessory factor